MVVKLVFTVAIVDEKMRDKLLLTLIDEIMITFDGEINGEDEEC